MLLAGKGCCLTASQGMAAGLRAGGCAGSSLVLTSVPATPFSSTVVDATAGVEFAAEFHTNYGSNHQLAMLAERGGKIGPKAITLKEIAWLLFSILSPESGREGPKS